MKRRGFLGLLAGAAAALAAKPERAEAKALEDDAKLSLEALKAGKLELRSPYEAIRLERDNGFTYSPTGDAFTLNTSHGAIQVHASESVPEGLVYVVSRPHAFDARMDARMEELAESSAKALEMQIMYGRKADS